MRTRCKRGFMWCKQCWYGDQDECAEGKWIGWRAQARMLFAAWLVLWGVRLQIVAVRIRDKAWRIDQETVVYLESVARKKK